jgi:DNA-binding transcriptional MocR family regulator
MMDELKSRLSEPTARGLADAVSRGVRDGAFEPGATLPPIRKIAATLKLAPATVSAAWALLSRAGVIHTNGRRGTVIADRASPGPARYRRALQYSVRFQFDLSTGLPDPDLLPDLAPALGRLHTAEPLRTYLDDPVLPDLLDRLHADWPFRADAITIADGVMDALDLFTATFLRFGDRVAVEHPTDPGLLDLLESLGTRVVPVPIDDAGPIPAALAAAFEGGARTVFLQPRAQQPTGVSLTAERADELAAVVRSSEAQAVEIDYFGVVASTAVHSLGDAVPDRTIHIRGYSASHGPELRIAALGGAGELMESLVQRRHLVQGWTSRLLQLLLLDLLTEERSIREVAAAREEYARRRRVLIEALAEHGVTVGGGDGRYVWLPVASEAAALVSLTSRSIGAAPGQPFMVEPGLDPHLCVTAGLLPTQHAAEIAEALADAAAPSTRGAGTGRATSPRATSPRAGSRRAGR